MSYKARIREDAMRLNPMDDAMFQKMAEDVAFPEEILQVILDDKVLKVLRCGKKAGSRNRKQQMRPVSAWRN